MLTLCYLPDQVKDLFDKEYLETEGIEVQDELALEINKTYDKLKQLSNELAKIRDEKYK